MASSQQIGMAQESPLFLFKWVTAMRFFIMAQKFQIRQATYSRLSATVV
jgi:hypothetical protein